MSANKPRPLTPKPNILNKSKEELSGNDKLDFAEIPPHTDDIKLIIKEGENNMNPGESAQSTLSVETGSDHNADESVPETHPVNTPGNNLTEENTEETSVESKPRPQKKETLGQTFVKTFIPQVFFDTPPKKPYPPR